MKPHTRWSPLACRDEKAGAPPFLPVAADHRRPAVRGVEQVGDRSPEDVGRLGLVDDAHGRRMPPPREHGRHQVQRERQRNGLERAEHLDTGRVEAGLLAGLAERGGDGSVVVGIDCVRPGTRPGPGANAASTRAPAAARRGRATRLGLRTRGRSAASRARRRGSARPPSGRPARRADRRATAKPCAPRSPAAAAATAQLRPRARRSRIGGHSFRLRPSARRSCATGRVAGCGRQRDRSRASRARRSRNGRSCKGRRVGALDDPRRHGLVLAPLPGETRPHRPPRHFAPSSSSTPHGRPMRMTFLSIVGMIAIGVA